MKKETRKTIKNGSKKFNKPNKKFLKMLWVLGGLLFASSTANIVTQEVANKIETDKVNEALEFYGGTNRYLRASGLFNFYTKFVPQDTKNIRVGLAQSVSERMETQLSYCVNYMNKMFDAINPNYHLNIVRAEEKNCDIYVQVHSVGEERMKNGSLAIT